MACESSPNQEHRCKPSCEHERWNALPPKRGGSKEPTPSTRFNQHQANAAKAQQQPNTRTPKAKAAKEHVCTQHRFKSNGHNQRANNNQYNRSQSSLLKRAVVTRAHEPAPSKPEHRYDNRGERNEMLNDGTAHTNATTLGGSTGAQHAHNRYDDARSQACRNQHKTITNRPRVGKWWQAVRCGVDSRGEYLLNTATTLGTLPSGWCTSKVVSAHWTGHRHTDSSPRELDRSVDAFQMRCRRVV
jgi:hypothetical protein